MHLYIGHPEAKKHEVYLDGEPILLAVEADDVEGYVVVLVRHAVPGYAEGTCFRYKTIRSLTGELVAETELRNGRVEFKRVAEGHWPYDWMTPEERAAAMR